MPYIDVDLDEFLDECDSYEIGEIIEWLKDEGHINSDDLDDEEPTSVLQELYEENLEKIRKVYLQISKEDFNTINSIAKKY
jgi:hypothetical protein